MEIVESAISCGVQELTDVGENPTMADYRFALSDGNDGHSHDGLGCFLIASVPWAWKKSVKFLKSVGFKSHGVRKNPNSKNNIVLLSKTLTAKERRSIAGRHCKDCDEPIIGRNRLCDMCKEDKKHSGWTW